MQYLDSNPRRSTPSFLLMVGFALMLTIQQNTTFVNAQTATPPSGSGTQGDPYLISSLENLYWLSQNDAVWDDNAYFLQTADIDASATSTWDAGTGFSPIGNITTDFTGNYDGDGHTISNLFINRLTSNMGLFGITQNTTVMNIGVIQADITGSFQTGTLIGFAQGGTIVKDSYATGLVSAGGGTVGGLIGASFADSVLRVYSSAQVTSLSARAGGLIANHNTGVIKDSYATGAVTATNWAGGLVAANNGSIENSYSTSLVNSTGSFVGGFVARNEGAGTITNSYWNTETSGQSSGIGTDFNGQTVTGLTTAQMRQQSNFSGFDFTDTWTMWEDFSEPYLQDVIPDSVGDYPFSFYPTGSGTSGDPYQIATLDNLFILSQLESIWDDNAYFRQTADIDASATSGWNSGAGFSPIGNATTAFKGTYNGGGHIISNLFMFDIQSSNAGLFGRMDSTTVRELGLVQVDISSAATNAGALAGYAGAGSIIKNSYVTGSVVGFSETGGLIGTSLADSVFRVYSSVQVNAEINAGGLIGNISAGVIREGYANGLVNAPSSIEGGIAGTNSGTLINTYWDTQKTGTSTGIVVDNNSQNPTGLTTAEMRQDSSFVGFDFGSTWAIVNGFSEPYLQNLVPDSINGFAFSSFPTGSGTFADPYLISSLEGLEILSETSTIWNSGAHFLQTTDIDASATSGWNSGAGFSPIGNDANRFSGSYNGNGYTISNLFINRNAQTHIGLFGAAEDAGFSNLTLEAVDITGLRYTGGLLGLGSQLDTLANISVSGSIEAAIATGNNAFAGGVGGQVVFLGDSSQVLTSSATITAAGNNAGGLFGEFDGNLTDSHASGDVRGENAVGGIIGSYFPGTPSVYSLNRVSASGDVYATERTAGGLIGEFFDASISNSYATGNVTGIIGEAGGLIGFLDASAITNSYASGNVSGSSEAGGFIGSIDNSNITNSYSSGSVSGTSVVGGFIGQSRDATITNNSSSGSVTGSTFVGGFIGFNDIADITNNYSNGSVTGSTNVGGFIGFNNSTANITNNYSSGRVFGSADSTGVGGFIGYNNSGTITNGYWNTQSSGQANGIGLDDNSQTVTGLSIGEMADSTNFPGFDFSTSGAWNIDDGFSFPYLKNLGNLRMVVATIDSGEGWRMIGNPGDVTYSELLDPVFTQGYEGSDGGTGFAPNVYFYEESTQTWTAPSKASDYFGKADSNSVNTALNGILLYVYGDDDGDGNEDSWPKYLLSESTTLNDTLDVSLSYTDNVSADSAGWNLVSNPYPVSLDWTEVVTNGDITNTFPVAYIWDDSLNAGAGAYRINYGYPLPPGLPQDLVFDGAIPAMQAFWVKATSTGASLSFKPDYQGASQVLYKQQPDHDQQPPVVPWISLSINNGHFSDQAVLFNSDVYKAPKLRTIASRYTEISIADDEQLWAATSLDSLEEGNQVTFPIHLSTTETGTFTISWQGLDNFGGDQTFTLIDTFTEQEIVLEEGGEYVFEVEANLKNNELPLPRRGMRGGSAVAAKAGKVESISTRFDLRVTAGTLVSDQPEQDLPATYALAQNYPNPFNPSTSIQFELPESGNVELLVFDVLGRQVATLVDDRMEAGYHQIRFDARNLASGVYLYQLRAGNTVLTKKLTLIK